MYVLGCLKILAHSHIVARWLERSPDKNIEKEKKFDTVVCYA